MSDYFEQIEMYLKGNLSDQEKAAFELELSKDPALQSAVENHDIGSELLDLLTEEDIRKELSKHRKVEEQNEAKAFNYKPGIILLAILLTLGTIGYLINQSKENKVLEVYASAYSPFIDKNGSRGEVIAIEKLSGCDKGHYLMEERLFEDAITEFQQSLSDSEEHCESKSQWYLSLCYLHTDNILLRDSLLEVVLLNPDHPYYSKAQQVQAALKEL